MNNINWGKLKAQGRVKEIGIPWSAEESKAIYELKIPADYVRKGILTIEDYEKAKQKGIETSRTKEEAVKEAKELGLEFVPEVDVETLEREIKKKKVVKKTNPKKKNVKKTKKTK